MQPYSLRALAYLLIATALAACAPARKPVPAPSPATDPRNNLKAGLFNAGEAVSNLKVVAKVQSPRGFLGVDPAVPQGYESLNYVVRIKGSGTNEEFAQIHEAVMATSPNFYNVSRPVALKPTLIVE